uniref:Uncharacterized protein n=1 Tax=Prymnesium polylepis TaxID=72548 RepID=A0A7S4HFH6_9EUKA
MARLAALLVAICASCASGYQLSVQPAVGRCRSATAPSMMAGKGFGKAPPAPPPKAKKPKSAGTVKRDAAGAAMDELTASGSPEYTVLIRTVGADGKAGNWMPVGGIAVPRSSSEDMALSMAIFNNEDDLLKGAFRNFPALKKSEDKFEYGYRLKEFPDDPVKLATKEATEQPSNPIMQWFNALDNPLNK